MKSKRPLGALLLSGVPLWLVPSSLPELNAQRQARVDTFRVVKSYPHDPSAYTQGLIYRDGFLFESTGLKGQSTLRKVKLENGEVVQQHRVATAYFAEGLSEWSGQAPVDRADLRSVRR